MRSKFRHHLISFFICLKIWLIQGAALADQADFDAFSKSIRDRLNGSLILRDTWLFLLLLLAALLITGIILISHAARKRKKITEKNIVLPLDHHPLVPDKFSYKVAKYEKRRWFRLPVKMDMLYTKKNDFALESSDFKTALLINLSADGLLFMAPEKLRVSDQLNLIIEFNPKVKLVLLGKVLRVLPNQNEEYPFQIAVQFVGIKEKERDQIMKYIFQYQREQI